MPKSTAIQAILSALRTERRVNDVFDAPDHQHLIKIYFQMQASTIRLRGVLCGADCRPILGARDTTRTITSEKLLPIAIDTMIHAVWHKWTAAENAKNPHCKMQRGRISNYFQVVQFEPADLGWAQSTYDGTLSYLRDSIAPHMDRIGEDICDEDLKKIAEDLIARACKSGRGKTGADGRAAEKDVAAARQQVIAKLDRCRRLYELARTQYPQSGLPDVHFPVYERVKVSKVEQPKELPADTRVVFANMLWLLANQGDARAYNAALMLYVGLRTGEAAAPKIGDIALADDDKYGSYFVAGKIRGGIYEPYPKTQAGYRTIILGSEMVQFIRLRIQQLQAQGYTAQEIENMPLGTTNDSELSACVKRLLLLAGCNSQIITESTAEAIQTDSTDVSAYILRRDWATRMANCCGMPMDMLDKLLGHARRDNAKRDYTTPEQQQRIAAIMDRCVLIPQLSQSPAAQPLILPNNTSLVLEENIRHQFITGEDRTVNLDIQALEPGQDLVITAPRGALQIQHVRLLPAKPAQRGTTVLQSCAPNCGYDACLQRAEQIVRETEVN